MTERQRPLEDQLSPETIEFLRELRESDIANLKQTVEVVHVLTTLSRFARWMVYFIMATFMAIASFGDSLTHIKTLIGGLFK